jgi:endonuclease/exonuclease/phosphatase family metal-dependent hydrolase
MKHKLITLALVVYLPIGLCRAGDKITIDGQFEDWLVVPTTMVDDSEEGSTEDFADLQITNDNDFLFLRFSFNDGEHLLQDLNSMRLFIDTDNNNQSGYQIHGIGAELEWCFGCRGGTYHSPTGQISIDQADIVLRSAPTITSTEFEMALGFSSIPMTMGDTQIPDTIAVVLASSDMLDFMPDLPGQIRYAIDRNEFDLPVPIPLASDHVRHIRVLTYNTLAGGLLHINRQDHFYRIMQALKPDIMAFQEQSGGDQVTSLMRDWFQERSIYGVEMGNNNIVVSRYPILNQALITGSGRTMAVLLHTESVLGANLLILNSHLACCTNNESRQHDADEIIMVMRKWYAGQGPFDIPEKTPIIHLGDFNLVGYSQQLKTLTEGDILDEDTFGEDFFPDWDNSPLADLFSRHTSIRMGYTWRNDNESFSPGKLDYILFTDSVIEPGNHFILNTLAMSETELEKYGLLSDDTNLASDHLPRIMDIASVEPVSGVEKSGGPHEFRLYQSYPNPFNPSTIINYELPITNDVELSVYNALGQKVITLVAERQAAGSYQVEWDASEMASGTYYYRIRAGEFVDVRKMVLIR